MDSAEQRRRARQAWPFRRVSLQDPVVDVIVDVPPAQLVAMVHRLTLDAWAMSGRPMPTYSRAESPGRVRRGRR